MRGGWIVIAGAAFSTFAFGAPAAACVYHPRETCIGSASECNPSAAERLARARRQSSEATRLLAIEARNRLRSGGVDFAAGLSELLVPNVRPVWVTETSCGPMGESDYGEGRESTQSLFDKLVAGTPYVGSNPAQFARLLRNDLASFGTPCNAEFRRDFAVYLRNALEPQHLQQAWLFLIARKRTSDGYGSIYPRLMSFEGNARIPPVRWHLADLWLNDQARRYVRRERAGRALAAAVDAFWAERGASVAEDRRACPQFSAEWEAERQRLLTAMTAQREGRQPARVTRAQP